jgi:hypothetical protein
VNIIRLSFSTHATPNSSEHSGISRQQQYQSPLEANIVEKIAYATSPSCQQQQQPLSANLQQQIQREAKGAKLLLLTLFCSKIRREYIRLLREHVALAKCVFDELIAALLTFGNQEQKQQQTLSFNSEDDDMLMKACCTAVAAVAVRSTSSIHYPNEGIMQIITTAKASLGIDVSNHMNNNTTLFSPKVALTLLTDLPGEAQSRNDLPSSD